MEYVNYVKLQDFSFFYYQYMIVDTQDYQANRLFGEEKIKVKFGKEFVKENSVYRLILCKVRKKDEEKFLQVLHKMKNRMYLLGYRNYGTFCQTIVGTLTENEGQRMAL